MVLHQVCKCIEIEWEYIPARWPTGRAINPLVAERDHALFLLTTLTNETAEKRGGLSCQCMVVVMSYLEQSFEHLMA
jgi:hypothetical protein